MEHTDYLTLQEAVTLLLASRYDGRGDKTRIVIETRACAERAETTLDVPPEAFYGEPLDPDEATDLARSLIEAAL